MTQSAAASNFIAVMALMSYLWISSQARATVMFVDLHGGEESRIAREILSELPPPDSGDGRGRVYTELRGENEVVGTQELYDPMRTVPGGPNPKHDGGDAGNGGGD
ncbi:hypothetical protein Cni_G00448 [Canna indica]|uniref:Uncharacterized protein n=1 Tax=Canna indica TaxID=4628 RepID=A0AAQ3JMR9_9LILI|nr:hypothetical protein Cni_G00448 [Canna indica]